MLCFLYLHPHANEIPRTDPLVQVDYVRVVDLDIGVSKSDIRAISVVTISERAGRTRASYRGVGVETAMAVGSKQAARVRSHERFRRMTTMECPVAAITEPAFG